MVRNEFAIWIPSTHCLVEVENSDILSVALLKVYGWTNNAWKMQYPLTDNSATEKAAVRKAFSTEGHVKIHLLCTVHSERTLSRRFRSSESKDTYNLLRHAMRVHTESECVLLCEQAMASAISHHSPNTAEADRRYIERDWLETRREWALFARQHNPLLLQATSSNACETWHARLKLGSGLRTGETVTHGIFGCVRTVHDCAHDVDNRTLSAQMDAKTRHFSLSRTYPSLRLFPYTVQKILATEESKVNIRIEQDMPTPFREREPVAGGKEGELGIYICHCLFSRRYQLPCQHIFHMDRAATTDSCQPEGQEQARQILTPSVWQEYFMEFGAGGMERYETGSSEDSPIAGRIVRPDDNKTLRVLKLAELNECIRSTFYNLDEVDGQESLNFMEGIENLIATIVSLPGSRPRAAPIPIFPNHPYHSPNPTIQSGPLSGLPAAVVSET
jgi:hypothetical protein